jgi:hypothetical protein
MTQAGPVLAVGAHLKEIGTGHAVYANCRVLNSDAVGLAFEVERTVSTGGDVETVVSQVFLPWASVNYVLLVEERT